MRRAHPATAGPEDGGGQAASELEEEKAAAPPRASRSNAARQGRRGSCPPELPSNGLTSCKLRTLSHWPREEETVSHQFLPSTCPRAVCLGCGSQC